MIFWANNRLNIYKSPTEKPGRYQGLKIKNLKYW